MTDALIASTRFLPKARPAAAAEYAARSADMRRDVDEELLGNPELARLLGDAPIEVMKVNHENHASFMAAVFRYNEHRMLARVVVWVYRRYLSHGFSPDYFVFELKAWVKAVRRHMTPASAEPILSVYAWMLESHDAMVAASKAPLPAPTDPSDDPVRGPLLDALIQGQSAEVRRLARERAGTKEELAGFFVKAVQPAMDQIGRLWEAGRVSVSQEHLASSIMGRVLAGISQERTRTHVSGRKALITSAPNEYHELGVGMVADVLEMEGWDVRYLGANTPAADVVAMAKEYKPSLIGISVSMPFNLVSAHELITQIRAQPLLARTKIIVGGLGFTDCPDLWRQMGADGFAADARSAAAVAATLTASPQ